MRAISARMSSLDPLLNASVPRPMAGSHWPLEGTAFLMSGDSDFGAEALGVELAAGGECSGGSARNEGANSAPTPPATPAERKPRRVMLESFRRFMGRSWHGCRCPGGPSP